MSFSCSCGTIGQPMTQTSQEFFIFHRAAGFWIQALLWHHLHIHVFLERQMEYNLKIHHLITGIYVEGICKIPRASGAQKLLSSCQESHAFPPEWCIGFSSRTNCVHNTLATQCKSVVAFYQQLEMDSDGTICTIEIDKLEPAYPGFCHTLQMWILRVCPYILPSVGLHCMHIVSFCVMVTGPAQ